MRGHASQLLQILIAGVTPDFPRTGPKNQDYYQTPQVILHTRNVEKVWTFNWNGGQGVGRKYEHSKSSLNIMGRFLELQQNDYNVANFYHRLIDIKKRVKFLRHLIKL